MKAAVIGGALALLLVASTVEARVVRLRVERRQTVLAGRAFGVAGPYEKLMGKVEFALDPKLPQNHDIVDLEHAPRNARGEVEFTADFYLLKPVDPQRGNGRLIYEVVNRGNKSMIERFQKAKASADPTTDAEFGDGALMNQGFALLWMGWQWDVPEQPERMRMQTPIATDAGKPITGLVRANIIIGERLTTVSLGDRDHIPYPVIDLQSQENIITVREHRLDEAELVPRTRWRFPDSQHVTLDGGFEPGLIYDVVYRSKDPRVIGCGLAGVRDLVSFFKMEKAPANPMPGIHQALGYGVSQSGRFLRHFLYQGFNEDEHGKRVFDGVFIQVAGAGRGSFNHRFAQASREGYRHFNLLYPTDLFPFTDAPDTDQETGITDGLLLRATQRGVVPKVFHILSSFEYWNRAASLIHTDPEGTKDADVPATSRIYFIASSEHSADPPFPPALNTSRDFKGKAPENPNWYAPVIRALFHALDQWVAQDIAPPPSLYPRFDDGTLTLLATASDWPAFPGSELPFYNHDAYRFDFGSNWSHGIIDNEPPVVGHAYGARVPSMDDDGNERAGIRLPEIEVPLASQTGWNFRHPDAGAPDELAGTIGSYYPFPHTRAEREMTKDARPSIEERYRSRDDYLGKITAVALRLIQQRYLLADDLPDVLERAGAHYDWATKRPSTSQSAGAR